MVLNLDQQFLPVKNQKVIAFEAFTFSGGEPHVKIKTDVKNLDTVIITHRVHSFNDLGLLLVTVDALRRMGVKQLELILPYFPGARQDRVMITGEALTVKVYADIINAQNFERVTIVDPHSEVTPALIKNVEALNNHQYIKNVVAALPKDLLLISPDGGALKKIYKLASFLQDYEVVECSKMRDIKTGQLSGFKVYSDDLQNRPCLIVDDICDGGGTFLGLAKALEQKNAGKLYLAVTHGIFSKGLEALTQQFEQIYNSNSFNHGYTHSQLIENEINI